jgi:rhodanese-related sulfurtransferase
MVGGWNFVKSVKMSSQNTIRRSNSSNDDDASSRTNKKVGLAVPTAVAAAATTTISDACQKEWHRYRQLFPSVAYMTSLELQDILADDSKMNDVVLIDVRTKAEQSVSMLPGAISFDEWKETRRGIRITIHENRFVLHHWLPIWNGGTAIEGSASFLGCLQSGWYRPLYTLQSHRHYASNSETNEWEESGYQTRPCLWACLATLCPSRIWSGCLFQVGFGHSASAQRFQANRKATWQQVVVIMQLVCGQPYLRIVLARKGRIANIPVPSVGDWWFSDGCQPTRTSWTLTTGGSNDQPNVELVPLKDKGIQLAFGVKLNTLRHDSSRAKVLYCMLCALY